MGQLSAISRILSAVLLFGGLVSAQNFRLVWEEQFEGDTLDGTAWNVVNWPAGKVNKEEQRYNWDLKNNPNIWLEGGNLIIEARNEGGEITSGRINSCGKKEFLYGRLEIRAILPTGRGTWPAIWMSPTYDLYGNWPKSGEIDIMEHVGMDQDVVHSVVHTGTYNHKIGTQKGAITTVAGASEDFHTYAVEWYPDRILGFADGVHYFTFTNDNTGWGAWPFDHPFHMILNIAIGGDWGGQQGIDMALFPTRLTVDYVKAYELVEESAAPVILQQPEDVTAEEMGHALFRVAQNHSGTYQWTKNGAVIPGAVSSVLSLPRLQLSDNGAVYAVTVTNSQGAVASSNAVLTVTPFAGPVVNHTGSPPVIDGTEDAPWQDADEAIMDQIVYWQVSSPADLSGSFKTLWDEENLYLLIGINDDIKKDNNTFFPQNDCIDVFLDASNDKHSYYDEDDFWYVLCLNKDIQYEHFDRNTGMQTAWGSTAGGYVLEAAIPWSTLGVAPGGGNALGLDLQITDTDDGGGGEQARLSWHAPSVHTWDNPSVFGTVLLAGGTAIEGGKSGAGLEHSGVAAELKGRMLSVVSPSQMELELRLSRPDGSVVCPNRNLHGSAEFSLDGIPEGVYIVTVRWASGSLRKIVFIR